jgi:GrpB-like predicted nucleotidyltransferase (UPF0157 family)
LGFSLSYFSDGDNGRRLWNRGIQMSKPLSEMTLQELWQLFPIQLSEHKEYWKDWYQEEKNFLASFLPKDIQIYHIGSTAISGIWAKPLIDILLEARPIEHKRFTNYCLETTTFAWLKVKSEWTLTKATQNMALLSVFFIYT